MHLYVDGGIVVGAINNNYCGFRNWFYKTGCARITTTEFFVPLETESKRIINC